ncbi:MAG: nucleotide exchange factor GrpE [Bacteroidaceae bacterium]|nr:nucleotide exchange factor GrpE [Bacteroidaceae bacterium]
MDNKEKLTEEEIKNQAEQQNGEEQNLQNVDIKEEDSQTEEEKQSDDNNNGTDHEEVLDPLAKAEAEIAELKDKYLRSVAEFDNYRKRTMKEKAELILNGSEKTITAILPIVDDMERAMANVEKADDMEAVKEGMELIYQKFQKTLESLGLKKIETADADFDTDFHEAIAMVPGMGDDKKGKILDCVQTGYKLNDKVIRHAKVAVGQ